LAWFVLSLLTAGYLASLWRWPLPVAGLTVLLLAATALLELRRRKHLKSLAAARPNESICTFTRALAIRELDPWVVRAVFEQLRAI
jgi:hypothetical protein